MAQRSDEDSPVTPRGRETPRTPGTQVGPGTPTPGMPTLARALAAPPTSPAPRGMRRKASRTPTLPSTPGRALR